MEKNFILRKANKEDTFLLIKYKLSTIYAYAENVKKAEAKQIQDYVNSHVPLLLKDYQVIVIDDKVVGCLLVTTYQEGMLLDEIYLEKEYRRKGIGSFLIQEVINEHNVVYLWVYKKNMQAILLYERLGFKIIDETEVRYFMKFCDEKVDFYEDSV